MKYFCEAEENYRVLGAGIHEKALRLYKEYLFVGGMPQAVSDFVGNGKDLIKVDAQIYKGLELAYLADMAKYTSSPAESVKITEVYRSVPRQLANENPKFRYSIVRPNANRRDFSAPLDWLAASGLIDRS